MCQTAFVVISYCCSLHLDQYPRVDSSLYVRNLLTSLRKACIHALPVIIILINPSYLTSNPYWCHCVVLRIVLQCSMISCPPAFRDSGNFSKRVGKQNWGTIIFPLSLVESSRWQCGKAVVVEAVQGVSHWTLVAVLGWHMRGFLRPCGGFGCSSNGLP